MWSLDGGKKRTRPLPAFFIAITKFPTLIRFSKRAKRLLPLRAILMIGCGLLVIGALAAAAGSTWSPKFLDPIFINASVLEWLGGLGIVALTLVAIYCTRVLASAVLRKDRLVLGLMERHDRLRDFILVASDWFWETDKDGRFIFASDPSGQSDQEVELCWVGLTWQDLGRSRESRASLSQLHEAIAARRAFRDLEVVLPCAKNNSRWLLISGKPLFDSAGQFRGYRGLVRDITDERAIRARSQAARSRLVRAIEIGSEGVALFDSADRLVFCNERFRELLFPGNEALVASGSEFADLLGHFARSGLDSDAVRDPAHWVAERLANRRQGVPGEHQVGDDTWIRYHDQRTPEGDWICLLSDVTSLKRREVELSRLSAENRRLAAAVNNTEAGVMISDPRQQGNPIVFVNPAFTRMTGYTLEEVLGRGYRLLQGPNSDHETLEKIDEAMARNVAVQADLYSYRKSGTTFWDRLVINPIVGDDGEPDYFVAIHQDVTRQKRFERELHAAKTSAEIANRSKSEFLANMSHELRTPLNAIIGFSDILRHEMFGGIENDRYREYIRDIHVSGIHLLDLINDILDLSKAEAGKIELLEERVDLGEAIESSIKMVRQRADDNNVTLSAHLPADLPKLLADERRLKQILLNLLTNAVKFTPSGGEVRLKVEIGSDDLVLLIEDEGIGIAPQDLELVMQPFCQIDSALAREQEGTGLGLPLTKRLVELHGAEFALESTLGSGSRAVIRFPRERLSLQDAA